MQIPHITKSKQHGGEGAFQSLEEGSRVLYLRPHGQPNQESPVPSQLLARLHQQIRSHRAWSSVTPKAGKSSPSPQTVTHCSGLSKPQTVTQRRSMLFNTRASSLCPTLTATASKCSTPRGTTCEVLAARGLVMGSWVIPLASPSTSSTTWLSRIRETTDCRSSPQRGSSSLPSEEKELNSVSSLLL